MNFSKVPITEAFPAPVEGNPRRLLRAAAGPDPAADGSRDVLLGEHSGKARLTETSMFFVGRNVLA